jgi:hypothetical protein
MINMLTHFQLISKTGEDLMNSTLMSAMHCICPMLTLQSKEYHAM